MFSAYAAQFGKRRWGDKRPSYIQRLDTIVRLFPDAQVIHIIRDGHDCVSSLERMPWWRGGSMKAIWTWRNAVIAGERARVRLGPGAYVEVRYEDLVRDPAPQLRRLCDFLDEPFDETMLEPHRVAEVAVPQRKLWHTRTHEPVNERAVRRWRLDLEKWSSICSSSPPRANSSPPAVDRAARATSSRLGDDRCPTVDDHHRRRFRRGWLTAPCRRAVKGP